MIDLPTIQILSESIRPVLPVVAIADEATGKLHINCNNDSPFSPRL